MIRVYFNLLQITLHHRWIILMKISGMRKTKTKKITKYKYYNVTRVFAKQINNKTLIRTCAFQLQYTCTCILYTRREILSYDYHHHHHVYLHAREGKFHSRARNCTANYPLFSDL